MGFKSLSDSDLDLKTLDGDMETLAANARKPFDTAPDLKVPGNAINGRVLSAAKSIQKIIDDTYLALSACP